VLTLGGCFAYRWGIFCFLEYCASRCTQVRLNSEACKRRDARDAMGERRVVDAGVYCRQYGIVMRVSIRVGIRQCCAAGPRTLGLWVAVHWEGADKASCVVEGGVVHLAVVTRLLK
jgi:hypothetical protein